MYLHVKQKIVTLATALCPTVGAGTAAATGPAPKREPEGVFLGAALLAWLARAGASLDIDQYVYYDCDDQRGDGDPGQ